MAEEKFAESLHLAQMGMFNLLENDVEQISQLATFAEGLLDYHSQCTDILKTLTETLFEKKDEAANRPKVEFVPKTLQDLNIEGVSADGMNVCLEIGDGSSQVSSPQHKPYHLELHPGQQSANEFVTATHSLFDILLLRLGFA
ncbi:unnamed protein product [Callosobruchus maculatus]|uniref:BAR domain-containing protein n=1 Tax=Callosobruchus maculatus TaxID=64391 RepID=A0A653DQI0_CALMS|nr:unnamed protein product [Callosobruchus maculatus]